MRISDWSSDVCSSDLKRRRRHPKQHRRKLQARPQTPTRAMPPSADAPLSAAAPGAASGKTSDAVLDRLTRLHPKVIDLSLGRVERLLDRLANPERRLAPVVHVAGTPGRSEARRVGKECASKCRSRVS